MSTEKRTNRGKRDRRLTGFDCYTASIYCMGLRVCQEWSQEWKVERIYLIQAQYPRIHVSMHPCFPFASYRPRAHPSIRRTWTVYTCFLLSCSTTQHRPFPSPLPRLCSSSTQRHWGNVPRKPTTLVRQGPNGSSHPLFPHTTCGRDSGAASSP